MCHFPGGMTMGSFFLTPFADIIGRRRAAAFT